MYFLCKIEHQNLKDHLHDVTDYHPIRGNFFSIVMKMNFVIQMMRVAAHQRDKYIVSYCHQMTKEMITSGVRSAERVLRGLVEKSKMSGPARLGPTRHDPMTFLTSLYL